MGKTDIIGRKYSIRLFGVALMNTTLELVLVLLASAVGIVSLARKLHLPPMLGYLLVGILTGPYALGWIPESEGTSHLAEFGVVFLMFSIGLEFSLQRLKSMRRIVFGLGFAQVAFSLLAVVGVCILFGAGWKAGVVLGGALAMSSTAIVVKMVAERMEMESAHGREIIGVLLFQDLAVVPLLIILPALSQAPEQLAQHLGWAILKAAAVLGGLLFIGQRIMRAWFHTIALRRSRELFMLNVLLITLGLAWLTNLAGLSLALGAFLAGMLIAETEYRHQVEEDIKPFRDVLLGLFFITVGMLLDLRVVAEHLFLVTALLAGLLLFKFLSIAGLSRLFRSTPGTALRTGLGLAQAGEFGFVILANAGGQSVVPAPWVQPVLAAMLLSMLAAPLIIHFREAVVLRLAQSEWMTRSLALHRIAVQSIAIEKHVVICGYGRTGQNLARLLESEGIRYVALDLDPERVAGAAAAGESVVYGDSARSDTLVAAGLARASALVISFNDTPASMKILHHARRINEALPVIVRTRDDADMDRLQQAGADEVVPDTFESSLMLGTHALVVLGIPLQRVVRRIRDIRGKRYQLLRGFFHGEGDEADDLDEAGQAHLRSVTLSDSSKAAGRSLGELGLEKLGVQVTAIRQGQVRLGAPAQDTRLNSGDVVVVAGTPEQIAAAEIRLQTG
jgi:CPA2 family monovalent cation:H+ antiporter-2